MSNVIKNTALFNMLAMTFKINTKDVKQIDVIADRGLQVSRAEDKTSVKRDYDIIKP